MILCDQIMLVIPSSIPFNEQTSVLRHHAYSTLDLVAEFVNQYPNMTVKVAAYSSAFDPQRINLVLTQEQAEKIIRYLWNRGIDTRLLYAEGYGGINLVTQNTNDWSSDNFRVEITLEKLPV